MPHSCISQHFLLRDETIHSQATWQWLHAVRLVVDSSHQLSRQSKKATVWWDTQLSGAVIIQKAVCTLHCLNNELQWAACGSSQSMQNHLCASVVLLHLPWPTNTMFSNYHHAFYFLCGLLAVVYDSVESTLLVWPKLLGLQLQKLSTWCCSALIYMLIPTTKINIKY